MGLNKYFGRVVDQFGRGVVDAQVSIYAANSLTLSTIYGTSDDGLPPISNPIQSGPNGDFSFWILNGNIDIYVRKNGSLAANIDAHICDCFPVFVGTSRNKTRVNPFCSTQTKLNVRAQAPIKRPIIALQCRVDANCRNLINAETRAVLDPL